MLFFFGLYNYNFLDNQNLSTKNFKFRKFQFKPFFFLRWNYTPNKATHSRTIAYFSIDFRVLNEIALIRYSQIRLPNGFWYSLFSHIYHFECNPVQSLIWKSISIKYQLRKVNSNQHFSFKNENNQNSKNRFGF